MPKISIVSPRLSSNALARTYILALVAKKAGFESEIVGTHDGSGLWEPLRSISDVPIRSIYASRLYPRALRGMAELSQAINSDLIYVSEPFFSGLLPAFVARQRRGLPIMVDVVDWELGFPLYEGKLRGINVLTDAARRSDSFLAMAWSEKLLRSTDAVTVVNTFLKDRYGGSILPHGRDAESYRPDEHARQSMRSELGLANRKIVLFLGTPHPYKGVADLVTAFQTITAAVPESLLMMVGVSTTGYSQIIRQQCAEMLPNHAYQLMQSCAFEDVPRFMHAADVVVIPQRHTLATIGQMPVKLIDAMAAGKAIVSTDVSDIRRTLAHAGWVVPPASPPDLAQAIIEVLQDPNEATHRGHMAREQFLAHHTIEALVDRFVQIDVVQQLLRPVVV
jgi:glycosyltransferase involved in cell wall biosynthesis